MNGIPIGCIEAIWRYPVKSMRGERVDTTVVTQRGVLGDRGYALYDPAKGKVASAKNPRQWPNLFQFQSAYLSAPRENGSLPAVRVQLPSGQNVTSEDSAAEELISNAVGRPVKLLRAPMPNATAEGYWPDQPWLEARNTSFEYEFPAGTFFDGAMVHVVATTTLNRLANLYPGSTFAVQRFRANIVIAPNDDSDGFVEDSWIGETLTIGTVRLRIERPCPRCVMTTLAQGELPGDSTILRAAVQQNSGNVGVYAMVESEGQISQGDAVHRRH